MYVCPEAPTVLALLPGSFVSYCHEHVILMLVMYAAIAVQVGVINAADRTNMYQSTHACMSPMTYLPVYIWLQHTDRLNNMDGTHSTACLMLAPGCY